MAYLAYVDESFNASHFYLGALVIEPAEAERLTRALEDLATQVALDYKLAYSIELHGYELFHAEKGWEPMKKLVRARIGVYQKIIDCILDHKLMLYFQCIDRKALIARQDSQSYPERFPPSQVCWNFLLQKLSKQAVRDDTQMLIIADEDAEHERRRNALREYRQFGTPGVYLKTKLPGILDTIHFAPSHHSRLLQAIDCVLFVYHRWQQKVDTHPNAIKVLEEIGQRIWAADTVHSGPWP